MSADAPAYQNTTERIVAHIRAQLADDSAVHTLEERDEDRLPVHGPVNIGIIPGCTDPADPLANPNCFISLYDAWATDLSACGISILAEHDLPGDMLMWLRIDALAGRPQILPIRVAYCTQILPTTWRIGALFLPID